MTSKARMHTAEHVFFRSLQQQLPDLQLEKIDIDETESSFFVYGAEVNIDHILAAEDQANDIVRQDRAVVEHKYSKEELANQSELLQKLRIKLERIKEDTVRVIEVKDFDWSACSGEHVSKTKEIGGILITRFNKLGKNRYEIKFKVDYQDELFNFARLARKVRDTLETDYETVLPSIRNLKENNEKLKLKVRELSAKIAVEMKEEEINGKTLITAVFPGINKRDFLEKRNAAVKENSLVVFINEEGPNTIAITSKCDVDAGVLLQKLGDNFVVKGGGSKESAQGSIEYDSVEKVFEFIKEQI